ncbi:DUF1351 domain-containing protein [uncultured Bacteroides sp.]|uniref:DUF1351 domain-containing protein n=1 Tax=uncultured Bacteroides sp. TaxID=162156 RepID=UPI002AAB1424|nr:DUF1351 domain-containing protein [uncultured Bacteroides sp.]
MKAEIQETDLQLVIQGKTLGSLTTNAMQIKSFVESILPNYDAANYNESNIEQAKKDKAALNKASKALNAKRLELEKEFMNPFTAFKETIGDTVKLIGDCSAKIDVVVKQSEQKYKDNKKAAIQKLFDGKGFSLVPFNKLFDEKWLNKTTKEKDINSDIDEKIAKIKDDIATLEAIGEDVDLLKSLYLDTLNLNSTIQYANTLKANREKVKAESKNVTAPIVQTQTIPEPEKETVIPASQAELYVRAFKVTGTREDIIALGDFMNGRGIKFEKIEI